MRYTYLKHKSDRSLVLKCDCDHNPLVEEKLIGLRPKSPAAYLRFPDGFIGVYPSPAGPVLFVNDQKYLFTDPSWQVSVAKFGTMNEVTFTGFAGGDLNFRYPAVELDPLDPWSEEEFDDLFIWLTTHKDSSSLIRMWTMEDPAAGPDVS